MGAAELRDSGFSRAIAWPESQPAGFASSGRNVNVSNENSQMRTNMAFAQSKPRSGKLLLHKGKLTLESTEHYSLYIREH